jgi:hypothetical protein
MYALRISASRERRSAVTQSVPARSIRIAKGNHVEMPGHCESVHNFRSSDGRDQKILQSKEHRRRGLRRCRPTPEQACSGGRGYRSPGCLSIAAVRGFASSAKRRPEADANTVTMSALCTC